jgi:hypothetical protein
MGGAGAVRSLDGAFRRSPPAAIVPEPVADADPVNLVRHVSRHADDRHRITVRQDRIMHNLTKRGIIAAPPHLPKGLSFEIADLIHIKGWADFHDLRIVVRLDHGTEAEEVIAFHPGASSPCHLIMWRNAKSVFVQPLVGRMRRYRSVAAALETLARKPRTILTDITPTAWPTD